MRPDGAVEIKDGQVPAVIGPGTLNEFATAQDMFAFIRNRMPKSAPGMLSEDQYWDVAAYLLYSNGLIAQGTVVGPATASRLRIAPAPSSPTPVEIYREASVESSQVNYPLLGAGLIVIAGAGGLLVAARRIRHPA